MYNYPARLVGELADNVQKKIDDRCQNKYKSHLNNKRTAIKGMNILKTQIFIPFSRMQDHLSGLLSDEQSWQKTTN